MQQGTLSTADPPLPSPRAERRRRIRHKLHSPVYASFKSPQAGMVVDLSELLDLSEDGFAVHTPEPLEAGRPLALTLDLPETRAYLHGHGVAVWSDAAGRGGVRFADLTDTSRRLLKEWLFADLLVAATNHAARAEQIARQAEAVPASEPPSPQDVDTSREKSAAEQNLVQRDLIEQSLPANSPAAPAVSPVEALRDLIRAQRDSAAALNLIADYACGWTGASGAALALRIGEQMICRAHCGDIAPPLGAPVDVTHGLSGECVRTAQIVLSDDTETDPRVDAETCRALGIGSILAAPVLSGGRVVGLLEVFAPAPHAFGLQQADLLKQLIPLIPEKELESIHADASVPVQRRTPSMSAAAGASSDSAADAIREPDLPSQKWPLRTIPRAFYLVTLVVVAILATTAGYLLAPMIQARWLNGAEQTAAAAAAPQPAPSRASLATSPEELRKLADSGDPEAQYLVGIRYATGANTSPNATEAAKWFQRAAEQNHVPAQARLASYYWSGRGVAKDLSKAYFWGSLALAQGDENSKMLLEGLSSQMTPSQKLAAQQQAENWFHQHNQQASTKN